MRSFEQKTYAGGTRSAVSSRGAWRSAHRRSVSRRIDLVRPDHGIAAGRRLAKHRKRERRRDERGSGAGPRNGPQGLDPRSTQGLGAGRARPMGLRSAMAVDHGGGHCRRGRTLLSDLARPTWRQRSRHGRWRALGRGSTDRHRDVRHVARRQEDEPTSQRCFSRGRHPGGGARRGALRRRLARPPCGGTLDADRSPACIEHRSPASGSRAPRLVVV